MLVREMLRVVDCLNGELVSSPVRADCDGGELQLLQLHPVNGAGAGVLVPFSTHGSSLFTFPILMNLSLT